MKKVKNMFWFFFLFVLLTYRIFFPDFLDSYFYDTCSLSYIDAKLEKRLSQSENGSSKRREELRNIDEKVALLNLTPEKEAKFKKAGFRMVLLKQNQCPVPNDVQEEFFSFLTLGEDTGSKDCPADMFLDESNKELIEMSKNQQLYRVFEDKVYEVLSKDLNDPDHIKFLAENWKNPEYRRSAILLEFQMEARKKNDCKDPYLPMRPFVMKFLDK